MNEFLTVALTFPTLPYSIVLAFSVLYWLLAALGVVDHGSGGHGLDLQLGDDGLHGISGMFSRLGLGGAPVMLVIALLAFFGWTVTYFVHLLLLQPLPATLRWLAGSATAVLALLPAIPLTILVLRPVRRLLLRLRPVAQASLLGRVGVVASPQVTAQVGHANVDDGGAGLILQVRIGGGEPLARGERVVLLDYLPQHNHYLVAREQDHPTLSFHASLIPGDKEIHR
ncbi:YqiJ family protein [Stenotrophomonas rhizophila]|uniref:YqiJ family protein n=1 Tax=Stenotrophomonas rhizophila TaxID=216778 RepID=UPI001E56CF2D|nr:YqiJ family protein [Stenotrophomonas rhizophila]MCC7632858.1 hypothetical protein [Stenotrophomonas rhizophila]MCC7662417.1 hypothetical protein [Stenotrophomonas rhizophila]